MTLVLEPRNTLCLVFFIVVSTIAMPANAAAAQPSPAPQPKEHGEIVAGSVIAINTHAKTFTVRPADGKETTLVWSTATGFSGEALTIGARVQVKWMRKNGRNWATSVRILARPAAPGN
jgi:hypothetical protein